MPMSEQIPRLAAVRRKRLDDLLRSPMGCRVGRHVEVDDASSSVHEDDEAIKQAESRRSEIPRKVMTQKCFRINTDRVLGRDNTTQTLKNSGRPYRLVLD